MVCLRTFVLLLIFIFEERCFTIVTLTEVTLKLPSQSETKELVRLPSQSGTKESEHAEKVKMEM